MTASFVTFLWSTSFVIIKTGLKTIPPLYFSSLRYLVGGFLLLTYSISRSNIRTEIRNLPSKKWFEMILYGIIFITLTQGLQFIGLQLLPAITVSLTLNFTTVIVIFLSIPILNEKPNLKQLIFILFSLIFGFLYLTPNTIGEIGFFPITILLLLLFANSFSSIYGRRLNKTEYSPLTITSISMLSGAIILLLIAIWVEEFPIFDINSIVIILFLAIINTAFAFTLWNASMEFLKAYEISVLNNLMLPQIAILAFFFLDEYPSILEWLLIFLVVISILLVQLLGKQNKIIDIDD